MFRVAEREARIFQRSIAKEQRAYYRNLKKEETVVARAQKKEETQILRSIVKLFGGKIAVTRRTPKQAKPV
jgi:hypothetical protein